MNVAAAFRLADGVTLRREHFGGLIYRYDNRRLYFIHSPETVEFLARLDGKCTLRDAVAQFTAQDSTDAPSSDTLLRTVEQLERLGVLRAVSDG